MYDWVSELRYIFAYKGVKFFIKPHFFRNSVLKCLFWVLFTKITCVWKKIFSTSCALVSEKGKKATRNNPPSPQKLYVGTEVEAPVMLHGWAGLTPPHIATLLVLFLVFSSFFFFLFCSAASLVSQLKLSQLEFSTVLLECQCTPICSRKSSWSQRR